MGPRRVLVHQRGSRCSTLVAFVHQAFAIEDTGTLVPGQVRDLNTFVDEFLEGHLHCEWIEEEGNYFEIERCFHIFTEKIADTFVVDFQIRGTDEVLRSDCHGRGFENMLIERKSKSSS